MGIMVYSLLRVVQDLYHQPVVVGSWGSRKSNNHAATCGVSENRGDPNIVP